MMIFDLEEVTKWEYPDKNVYTFKHFAESKYKMETEVKIFLDSSDAISEHQLLEPAFIRDLANSARELENRSVDK